MGIERDWGNAVKKLTDKTNSNKIVWTANEDVRATRENVQGPAYAAVVNGRWIAVYQYKYKYYTDMDKFEWCDAVAIELIRPDGTLEWKWPEMPVASQLLDAARAQIAGAGAFYDQLLHE